MKTFIRVVEVWVPDSQHSLLEFGGGFYGNAHRFGAISRSMCFGRGEGLPGLAWDTGLPVFMPDLGKGGRFLRADGAVKVGINRGFATACSTPGTDTFVMAFLSALATPIVRRFESWLTDCSNDRDGGALGGALATGVPQVAGNAGNEPAGIGAAAKAAGLEALVAPPVFSNGGVTAVVAWYF